MGLDTQTILFLRTPWVASTQVLHLDDRGNPTAIIEINNDISERKLAEEALRKNNDDLIRMNRAMIGRELRMVELKEEVNALCAHAGQPLRYAVDAEKS